MLHVAHIWISMICPSICVSEWVYLIKVNRVVTMHDQGGLGPSNVLIDGVGGFNRVYRF